jgi:hypothetical protein
MRSVFVLVAVLLVSLSARPSSARATKAALPLDGAFPALVDDGGGVVVVGTRWRSEKNVLVVVRWDVARGRATREATIAEQAGERAVAAGKSGDRIFVVTSGVGVDDVVELFEIDAALRLVRREQIGRGTLPSLAIVDQWIVTGFFEPREPTTARDRATGFAPSFAMHVQVRDRQGLALHGARMFRGQALLAPHPMPPRGGHAIAAIGARVVVSVPEVEKATLRALRLPSLDTEQQIVLDRTDPAGSTPVHSIGDGVIAAGDALVELSPSLEVVARHDVDVAGSFAVRDPRTGRLATDARLGPASRPHTTLYGVIVPSDVVWTRAGVVAVGTDQAPGPKMVVRER